MCDPVTATALALSAGGTYLESREADKNAKRVQNAKNDAFTAEMIRQDQYADEAGAAFNHSVQKQGKENFDQQKEIESQRLKQAFAERRTQPDYNVGLTRNAPKNVVMAREKASGDAAVKTDRDVGNLANLYGYGGAMFNQDLDRSEFGRLFGNVRDKALGQTNLFPLRLNAAATNAQKAPSMIPKMMKLAGTALSLGSAAGAFDGPGWAVPGTGSASKVVNGVPMPGTKPMFIKNPFGTLGAA